jgi:hypothetical protein
VAGSSAHDDRTTHPALRLDSTHLTTVGATPSARSEPAICRPRRDGRVAPSPRPICRSRALCEYAGTPQNASTDHLPLYVVAVAPGAQLHAVGIAPDRGSACLPSGLIECVTTNLGASRRHRTCPRTRAASRDLTRVADVASRTQATASLDDRHPTVPRAAVIPSAFTSSSPAGRPLTHSGTGIHAFVHPGVPLAVLPS